MLLRPDRSGSYTRGSASSRSKTLVTKAKRSSFVIVDQRVRRRQPAFWRLLTPGT
jgi:hypothetical protein